MEVNEAWRMAYIQMELQFDQATFNTCIKDTIFLGTEEDDRLYILGVRNDYVRAMLQHRLYRNVRRILHDVCGHDVEIRFEVHAPEGKIEPEKKNKFAEPPEEMPLFRLLEEQKDVVIEEPLHEVVRRPKRDALPECILNPRLNFDRFVVSGGNEIAYQAARAVADAPGRNYNPFFVYGDVGLGKTHLLQAVAHACINKGLKVLYIPSEVFTNDLVSSIRTRTTAMFRDKYRGVDVLLVDDVQFIAGKDSTQEEFFHTFNVLATFDKQIVVASDRPPTELTFLEDRLRSRFQGGLVTDVAPLTYEARLALLKMWASERGLAIPNDVLQMVAGCAQNNVRELEGMFHKIAIKSDFGGGVVTMENAQDTIRHFDRPRNHSRKRVTIDDVIAGVCVHFKMDMADLTGKSRTGRINTARQIAMFLAREMTDLSLKEIGDSFGRSHSTVLHGSTKIEADIEQDAALRQNIESIRAVVRETPGKIVIE